MLQGPAYLLRTPRLELACAEPRDTQELHDVVRAERARLAEHLAWAREEPLAFDVRLALVRTMRARFDLGEELCWIVRADGRFAGMAGLHAGSTPAARACGYWLRADMCGRGLASEAVCAVLAAAFLVEGAQRVELRAAAGNARSLRLAARLGFAREGVLRGAASSPHGAVDDLELHALLRDDPPCALRASLPVAAFDALGRELFDTARLRPSAFRPQAAPVKQA